MDNLVIENQGLDAGAPAQHLAHDPAPAHDNRPISFGEFCVYPGSRSLKLGQSEVPLGSRAFDLLLVLLRSRGSLVTKDEIVREVWPSTFVDESNLRFQMGVLRKALGEERDRIKTIPGRGYIFIADDSDAPLPVSPQEHVALQGGVSRGASSESVILIVEPNADERDAMTMLLRALKVSVIGFRSVEEVAAFTLSPRQMASR